MARKSADPRSRQRVTKQSLKKRRPLLSDLLLGALCGAAGTWVMDQATTAIYDRQPKETRDREDAARGEKTAYENAAEQGAAIAGRKLTKDERKQSGSAIHWALGVSTGAVYGLLRNRLSGLGIGSGLVYGMAIWIALDEAGLTLLGLTPPPQALPWQTHARGLAGHLVLGAVIEPVFDLLDLID